MKVVYLTGAPGSGKTTALDGLLLRLPEIAAWKYSERLSRYIEQRLGTVVQHDELRRASAAMIGPEDIAAVDQALSDFITSTRVAQHVVIDSHPVTKEAYGFRSTPFAVERLISLSLTEIWVTYVDAETTLLRLNTNQSGRKAISREEAATHTSMQASVAIQYGILAGCPVYFFDATMPTAEVIDQMQKRLMK